MKPDAQERQRQHRDEQPLRPGGQPGEQPAEKTATPPNKPGQYAPDALEQTAEPDGQFPENPHGTLDDRQPAK